MAEENVQPIFTLLMESLERDLAETEHIIKTIPL